MSELQLQAYDERMPKIKNFLLFLFWLFVLIPQLKAQDRSREMFNFAYAWNPSNEFHAFDAKLGAELISFSTGKWSAVASIREADLELTQMNSSIHLKNYQLSLPLAMRLGGHWFFISSPKVSVRNASNSLIVAGDTLYPSIVNIFNYKSEMTSKWTFSMGALYSKEMEDNFFLPIVGAAYSSPPYKLNLGFPNFGAFYQPSPNWEIGLKANFDSSTYTLPESSSLRTSAAKGIKLRIIDVGPAANFKITKNIWLNTNMGVIVLAEGQRVSERGTTRDLLYKGNNPLFVRASLSYYPFE